MGTMSDLLAWRSGMYKVYVLAVFLVSLTFSTTAQAAKVFVAKYQNQAKYTAYEVKYENQANCKVYKVPYENQAGLGKWFFVKYENQADCLL